MWSLREGLQGKTRGPGPGLCSPGRGASLRGWSVLLGLPGQPFCRLLWWEFPGTGSPSAPSFRGQELSQHGQGRPSFQACFLC